MTTKSTNASPQESTEEGLEVLYRRYSRALHRFLTRYRFPQDDVADIVQETYCRVLHSGELERIRHPRAFLMRVAHNVAINVTKRRRTAGEFGAIDVAQVELVDEQPTP